MPLIHVDVRILVITRHAPCAEAYNPIEPGPTLLSPYASRLHSTRRRAYHEPSFIRSIFSLIPHIQTQVRRVLEYFPRLLEIAWITYVQPLGPTPSLTDLDVLGGLEYPDLR